MTKLLAGNPLVDTDTLHYYTDPGPMTDLRRCSSSALEGLPADDVALCRLAQGLIVHEFLAELYGVQLSESRRQEVRIRQADRMIEHMLTLDAAPLIIDRPPERRMIGNCRHFSTLSCALLRHQAIPARARCGFADYFEAGKYVDHWVVEHWHARERRWVRSDSQLDGVQRDTLKINFDSEDVPPGPFLTAAEAWQKCRRGEADASTFGIQDMWGLWFIAGNVIRDLAALNKMELLPWDSWGRMAFRSDPDADGLVVMDNAAAIIARDDLAAVRNLYEGDETLKVPGTVIDGRFGTPHALA